MVKIQSVIDRMKKYDGKKCDVCPLNDGKKCHAVHRSYKHAKPCVELAEEGMRNGINYQCDEVCHIT